MLITTASKLKIKRLSCLASGLLPLLYILSFPNPVEAEHSHYSLSNILVLKVEVSDKDSDLRYSQKRNFGLWSPEI
jgi:hypothetical protein